MKKIITKFVTSLVLLILGPAVGLLALLLVHLLPVDSMRQNVFWSMDMIEKEFADEVLVDGFDASMVGNFTDCLMLEHAIYNGNHTVLEQTLGMYRAESNPGDDNSSGWHPGESLEDYLLGNAPAREVGYSRYWHGYLVLLKPMLMLMSVGSIRLFNAGAQVILFGLCIMLMAEKKKKKLSWAFIASMPFLYSFSTFSSLSLSICMYLIFGSLIVELLFNDVLTKNDLYAQFFMLLGMLTAYFDFLTYPIAVLGFALIGYLALRKESRIEKYAGVIHFSIKWGIGYFWMWASKWILCDLILKSQTISDAFSTIGQRTQNAVGNNRFSGFAKVVSLNLNPFLNRPFAIIALITVAVTAIVFLRKGSLRLLSPIPYLIVALYPFAWWFVMQNHSEEHWMFTCRIFAVTVCGVVAAVGSLRKEKPKENELK